MQLLAHRSRNHWYPRRTGCVRGRKEVRQYRRADSFLQYCPHNGHLVFAKLAVAFRKSMPIAYKGKYLFSIQSVDTGNNVHITSPAVINDITSGITTADQDLDNGIFQLRRLLYTDFMLLC